MTLIKVIISTIRYKLGTISLQINYQKSVFVVQTKNILNDNVLIILFV